MSLKLIGRRKEIAHFTTWLQHPEKKTHILYLSGIGGIGKTSLALFFTEWANMENFLTLWIDGSTCPATPFAMLSEMERMLRYEYGRDRDPHEPLTAYLMEEFSKQRTLLVFDRFERMAGIKEWLLHHFFKHLPDHSILVVITSRTKLPTKWAAHPRWGNRIDSFHLDCLSREESSQFLSDTPLPEPVRYHIVQRAEGYPLLLSLLRGFHLANAELSSQPPFSAALSAELFKEGSSPLVYDILRRLSLLPFANPSMLNQLLPDPIDDLTYEEIGSLSFIARDETGFTLHHIVSGILREEWKRTDPDRYHAIREKAIRMLSDRFNGMDHRAKLLTTTHVLELYRESLPAQHPYADFTSVRQPIAYQPLLPEERKDLHRLLAGSLEQRNWQSEWVRREDYHSLLEEIARQSPEGILPIRSETGELLAFLAGIWLHRNNLPLFKRYTPELYESIIGEKSGSFAAIPPEEADSLYLLMSAVDDRHPFYRPEELGSLLMQAWLTHMTMDRRGLVPTSDEKLISLLRYFGFRKQDLPSSQNKKANRPEVWELDFRHAFFQDWVRTVIQQLSQGRKEKTKEASNPANSTIPLPLVKKILRHLYDTEPLAAILHEFSSFRRADLSGTTVRRYLENLLAEEGSRSGLTREEKRILRECYLTKEKSKTELADSLHMSRTTFYRHSQQALKKLSHLFAQYLSKSL